MTKNMKSLILTLLAVAALSAGPLAARAESNLDALQVRKLSAYQAADRKAGLAGEAVRLWYVGTATEAVVTITTTSITAYAPAGTADSANFGLSLSSYQLNTAAYNTMGELCDAIDALTYYGCELLGARRDDASALLKDQVATSGTNDLKASIPLSGNIGGGARILLDAGVGTLEDPAGTVYVDRVGIRPAAGKRVRLKTVTCNGNVIGTLNISGKLQKYEGISDGVTRDDSTIVWSAVTADDTDLTIPGTVTEDGFLSFAKDAHVVVSVGNGTSSQAAANFCQAQWTEE
jgi:hypothetical protein